MDSSREIYVFRHGQTDWNVQERFQGHIDVPMNGTGRQQARDLIPLLRDKNLQAILSSDLSRALETAQIVATGIGIPVFQDAGLREAHLGDAQGLTRHEIELRFGEDLARRWRSWHVSDADIFYPGGESGVQVIDRCFKAMTDFLHSQSFHRIGVATHGGVIRRIMQSLLPPGADPVPIPNTVLYCLRYNVEKRAWTL